MAQNLRVDRGSSSEGNLPAEERAPEEQSVARLVGDIVADAQKLVRQEIALARVELQEEWKKTKDAARGFTVAVVMGFVTVFIAGMAIAHILEAIGVTLWLSYVLVTVLYGGIAGTMLFRGTKAAKQIDFVPRQTVESMKENVQWIRNQT